jgi:hypothetical protein
MTTPLVPWFISELFKQEISKIQVDIVERLCRAYGLDKSEVLRELDIPEIEFVDNTVRIIKRCDATYGSKTNTKKCVARVYDKNERTLLQCKRSQKKGCGEYCKSHHDLVKQNKLTLGKVSDPVPAFIKNKMTSKIY